MGKVTDMNNSIIYTNDSCIGCNKCISVCSAVGACISKMENDKLYEIGNIDKKVIDIHIGYRGNGIVNPILLILTEDGSLRHVKLVDAIANGTYAASDVILKKVVRIEDVVVSKNNVETNSIVLITEDGNIYDIANII